MHIAVKDLEVNMESMAQRQDYANDGIYVLCRSAIMLCFGGLGRIPCRLSMLRAKMELSLCRPAVYISCEAYCEGTDPTAGW